ncbi:hypothetical protein VTN02DRAFT_2713 [Thermoascus thermophilus]
MPRFTVYTACILTQYQGVIASNPSSLGCRYFRGDNLRRSMGPCPWKSPERLSYEARVREASNHAKPALLDR